MSNIKMIIKIRLNKIIIMKEKTIAEDAKG